MPQTATDIQMESMTIFAMLFLPAHGSIVLQCLNVFVPSAKEGPQSMQRHLHCIYLSLQSRLEMVAYIALVQTDTQIDTGTCWKGWVCLLRVFAETKDEIRGTTIWLPNIKLSRLLNGSCDSHTHTHTEMRDKPTHGTCSESLFSTPHTAEAGEPVEDF